MDVQFADAEKRKELTKDNRFKSGVLWCVTFKNVN